MTHRLSFLVAGLAAPFVLSACIYVDEGSEPVRKVVVEREVIVETGPAQDDRLNATLWAQQAVEYKATTDGIYALAAMRLDEALADPEWTAAPDLQGEAYQDLPPAIILDADETVLDNTPYAAADVLAGEPFSPDRWNAWASAGVAKAVPGAVDFTRACGQGCESILRHQSRRSDGSGDRTESAGTRFPNGWQCRHVADQGRAGRLGLGQGNALGRGGKGLSDPAHAGRQSGRLHRFL